MFSLTLRPEILSVNIRNHVGCLSWALSWAHISGPGSPYGFSRSSTSETSSRQRCESPNSSSREHVVLFPPHDNMQQGPTAPFTAIHASFSGPHRLGRPYQGRAHQEVDQQTSDHLKYLSCWFGCRRRTTTLFAFSTR